MAVGAEPEGTRPDALRPVPDDVAPDDDDLGPVATADADRREDDESVGGGIGRVLAFSDGVFSIAATLLVLNLKVPRDLHGVALHHAIGQAEGDLVSAVTTFAAIGLYWLGHRRMWARIERVDHRLLQANLGFLGLVILLPFAAQVLGSYGDRWGAVVAYATLIAILSLWQVATGEHVRRAGLAIGGSQARQAGLWRTVVIAAVFLVSIPIALVSPRWATREWVLCLVFVPLVRHYRARHGLE